MALTLQILVHLQLVTFDNDQWEVTPLGRALQRSFDRGGFSCLEPGCDNVAEHRAPYCTRCREMHEQPERRTYWPSYSSNNRGSDQDEGSPLYETNRRALEDKDG